jgi:DNA-directed RNA polymerase specialized sigma24 family protein
MLYKEGLADRFGSPIAPHPYLFRHRQAWTVQFNPEYQWLIGGEVDQAKALELGDTGSRQQQLKEQVLEVLPRLSRAKQEILTLLLVHRKHPSDIAAILGCSYANIHIHLYGDGRYKRSGAVAQLQRILKTQGGST